MIHRTIARNGGWHRTLPWFGLAAGALLLAWVLRDLETSRFLRAIGDAEPWPLFLVPVSIIAESLIRAEKWRHMLAPLVTVARRRLFGAIMAGYFANMLTPVRVSPLVRAWLVARLENMPTMSLLATIALDRTIDGLVFVGFVILALATVTFPERGETVREALIWGGGASLLLMAAIIATLIGLRRGLAARLASMASRLPVRRLPARWRRATARFTDEFVDGVVWPRESWRGVLVVVASVVIKLVAISYFMWAGIAFGVVLPLEAYLYLMVFLGFLIILTGILKIVGGFTAGAVFALQSFGVGIEVALAMTLVVQALSHATVAIIGAATLWLQGVGLNTLLKSRSEKAAGDSSSV